MRADLHVHTYYSDGLLTPGQVVNTAAENGVKLLAITDHDCELAFKKAQNIGKEKGVTVVRGTEISAYIGEVKLHTLAYNFNKDDSGVKNFFERLRVSSYERTEDILNKLKSAGVSLDFSEIEEQRHSPDSPVHSMYIARVGAKHGYALNPFEFYKNFLMRGKVAFSKLGRPSPEETVEVFTVAGGLCSLAHPGRVELDKDSLLSLILKLKDCGLRGIEAVYSTHTKSQTAYFKEIANKLSLYITCGSDTHFKEGNRKIGFPYFEPGEELLQKLLH